MNTAIGEDIAFKRFLLASQSILKALQEIDRTATRPEIIELALQYGSNQRLTETEIHDVLNWGWSSFVKLENS